MVLIHDLRYALRVLRRKPGYVLTCVPVLALGIGANAAIFSVIDSVILRNLKLWNRPERPPPTQPPRTLHYDIEDRKSVV